jgi:hypothetical protein
MIKQARLLLLTLGTLLALAAPASATTDYVSLGDSATAGPLIPTQIRPFGCYKSSNNYPHLTAAAVRFAQPEDRRCDASDRRQRHRLLEHCGGLYQRLALWLSVPGQVRG